jgi:glycosyltransferase involved in cell wall biosynthesis
MARLMIVTDAWHPQINGAVTTLSNTVDALRAMNHAVDIIEPGQFPCWPCPTYPELPLARPRLSDVAALIETSAPTHLLIATEGPLGLAARRIMVRTGRPFATAFFTRFHDYLWDRFRLPHALTLGWLLWFHRPAHRVLTPTPAMRDFLAARGLAQARAWRPGVDTSIFKPCHGPASALIEGLARPILLNVGRVAVEKNVEAFLSLDVPGSKVLVGDGPLLPSLRRRFPQVTYLGYRTAREIAELCSTSDVLVFPSCTDTFGHVMVEALACGLPVAAYPVRGPLDVVSDPDVGALDPCLPNAVRKALSCDRDACARFARHMFDWGASTEGLLRELSTMPPLAPQRADAPAVDGQTTTEPSADFAAGLLRNAVDRRSGDGR